MSKSLLFWILFAVLTAFYALYSRWAAWTIEDAMITARIAKNFVLYNQLTYNPGIMLSSATSPVVALAAGLMGKLGLETFTAAKILGTGLLFAGAAFFYRALEKIFGTAEAFFSMLFYLIFPTTAAYAICGLETPIYEAACFCALAAYALRRNMLSFFFASAAFMVRPDGVIMLAVVGSAILFEKESLQEKVRWTLPGFALLAVFFSGHAFFYGSPIPHTALAKAVAYSIDPASNVMRYLKRLFLDHPEMAPVYALALAGVFPVLKTCPRMVLFPVWFFCYYLLFMLRSPLFDWYLHPPEFVPLVFAAIAMVGIFQKTLGRSPVFLRRAAGTACVLFIVGGGALAARHFGASKIERMGYENSVRAAAGKWLKENTDPADLVFTESLGYIGFYSDNSFIDWPGLVFKDGVRVYKGKTRNRGYLEDIGTQNPVYLVLRDQEWQQLDVQLPAYKPVAHFPAKNLNPGYLILKRNRI